MYNTKYIKKKENFKGREIHTKTNSSIFVLLPRNITSPNDQTPVCEQTPGLLLAS